VLQWSDHKWTGPSSGTSVIWTLSRASFISFIDQIVGYTLRSQSIRTKVDCDRQPTSLARDNLRHSAQPLWTIWVPVVSAAARCTVLTLPPYGERWGVASQLQQQRAVGSCSMLCACR